MRKELIVKNSFNFYSLYRGTYSMQKEFILFMLFYFVQVSNVLASDKPKKKTHNPYVVSNNHQQGASEKTLHGNEVSLSSSGYNNQNENTYSYQRNLSYAQQYANYLLHQRILASSKNSQIQKYQENDDDCQQYNHSFDQGSYNQQSNISNNVSNQQVFTFNYQRNQSNLPSYGQQLYNSYQFSLNSKNSVNYNLSNAFFNCNTTESVKNFIEQMPVEELDFPIDNNLNSIGHILLQRRDHKNFKIWLEKGASCSTITGNAKTDHRFNRVTILHSLCIKGLDFFPDLLDVVKKVLNRNPSLLLHLHNGQKSAADLILKNKNIDDKTTLEILKEFESRGFDFTKDPIIYFACCENKSFYIKDSKPKSVEYVISCIEKNLQK